MTCLHKFIIEQSNSFNLVYNVFSFLLLLLYFLLLLLAATAASIFIVIIIIIIVAAVSSSSSSYSCKFVKRTLLHNTLITKWQ